MKKIYAKDFNNVLRPVIEKIQDTQEFEIVEDARNADCLVSWQDVRGDMLELAQINEEYLHKPFIVLQHGRAATNDYLAPNKFPMHATKFCCWGVKDYERLVRAGYKDRTVITGSSVSSYLKPKEPHEGKNIVFCPIITMHEEPINIHTYWHLKRIEIQRSMDKLVKCQDALRNKWDAWLVEPTSATEGSIPYYNFNKEWRLIAKITDTHDKRLYFGDVITTNPHNDQHILDVIRLLQVTDCVVGVEEGTFQLLAMAMGVPVVMVDGFKYIEYGGIDYSSVEMVKTNGVRRVNLSDLEKTIDGELITPDALKFEREQVVKEELYDGTSDPIKNIIEVIRGELNG